MFLTSAACRDRLVRVFDSQLAWSQFEAGVGLQS